MIFLFSFKAPSFPKSTFWTRCSSCKQEKCEEAKKSNASANLVRGYTWASEFDRYVEEPYMDYAPTTGAGSMVSNVLDYAKWLR